MHGDYLAKNITTEDTFLVDKATYLFLKQLDGKTSPFYCLPHMPKQQVMQLLNELKQKDLVRSSRIDFLGIGSVLISIWMNSNQKINKRFCCIANQILLLSFLPIFLVGVGLAAIYWDSMFMFDSELLPNLGMLIGALLGMFLHEFGHAAAAGAYGVLTVELGVMLNNFIPGAYVMIEPKSTTFWKDIQINAAGIEMNLLLCGTLLFFSVCFPSGAQLFAMAAVTNGAFAAFNLSLFVSLDGMKIIELLLDVKGLYEIAFSMLFSKEFYSQFYFEYVSDRIFIYISAIVIFIQIGFIATVISSLFYLFFPLV